MNVPDKEEPQTYMRRDHIITNLTTGVVEQFKTANQAKRRSHEIQMDNDKHLGRGSVVLGAPLKKRKHKQRR